MSTDVVDAATCVTAAQNGIRVRLTEGVVWDATEPFVLYRPDLFRNLMPNDREARGVETATRAPGEVRKRGRPKKVAAPAPEPVSEDVDGEA